MVHSFFLPYFSITPPHNCNKDELTPCLQRPCRSAQGTCQKWQGPNGFVCHCFSSSPKMFNHHQDTTPVLFYMPTIAFFGVGYHLVRHGSTALTAQLLHTSPCKAAINWNLHHHPKLQILSDIWYKYILIPTIPVPQFFVSQVPSETFRWEETDLPSSPPGIFPSLTAPLLGDYVRLWGWERPILEQFHP